MIEFNGLNRFNEASALNTYLNENLKALAVDLAQNPDHAAVFQNFREINDEQLLTTIKKVLISAEILTSTREARFIELISGAPQYQEIQELNRHLKEASPDLDQELSLMTARALNLADASIETVRAIDSPEKGKVIAAWINLNRLSIAEAGLTNEELIAAAPYVHYLSLRNCKEPALYIALCSNAYLIHLSSVDIKELKGLPPRLQSLTCVNCPSLTTLSISDAQELQGLTLNGCPLTSVSLPETPQLRNVYCYYCCSLTTLSLPHSPRLQFFGCGHCYALTTIELRHAPRLNYMTLADNFSFTTLSLSDTSRLKHFYMSCCNAFTDLSFPATPALEELDCTKCLGLTAVSLTTAPLLKKLELGDCTALTTVTLPATPALEGIKFSGSERLTNLSLFHTPKLKYFDCSSTSITTLQLPHSGQLRQLYCKHCPYLSRIHLDYAPLVQSFNCQDCGALTEIEVEALPNCAFFCCMNCPNLRSYPQLPPTSVVFSSGSNGFLTFPVNPLELEQNPRQVLLRLGNILLANQPMPNIVWWDPLTNQPAKGIDAGGLRRQLMTTLCDHLGDLGEDVLVWRIMARLIALCSTSSMLMGEHLPLSFFYALRAYLFPEGEIEHSVPVATVAEELKRIPRYSLDLLRDNPARFIERVRGRPITKEALLAKMQFEGMREFFEKYMEENPHRLADLLELFTSCRTLGEEPITIRVFAERDLRLLPLIHTCSQEVEMPLYPTYELFKEKLNLALSALKTFENI